MLLRYPNIFFEVFNFFSVIRYSKKSKEIERKAPYVFGYCISEPTRLFKTKPCFITKYENWEDGKNTMLKKEKMPITEEISPIIVMDLRKDIIKLYVLLTVLIKINVIRIALKNFRNSKIEPYLYGDNKHETKMPAINNII